MGSSTQKKSRHWKHGHIISLSSSLLVGLTLLMPLTLAGATTLTTSSSSSSAGGQNSHHHHHPPHYHEELRRKRSIRGLSSSSTATQFFKDLAQLHVPHMGNSDRPASSYYKPPPLPRFYEVPGTEYVPLSDHTDFSVTLDKESGQAQSELFLEKETDWCLPAEASSMTWTSEQGKVKLNGETVFLKGINW